MLTPEQREAIQTPGNILVVAGAGAGKTSTLVQRCLYWLKHADPRTSLQRMALVTFTEAAAAEMRHRIRLELIQLNLEEPANLFYRDQLLLLDACSISTLHSFCLLLIRQNFFDLQIDPDFRVLNEADRRFLIEQLLLEIFEEHYSSNSVESVAVKNLVMLHGNGWDRPIKNIILQIHQFSRSLPDPNSWLEKQIEIYSTPSPVLWEQWFLDAAVLLRTTWAPQLNAQPSENIVAAKCLRLLENWKPSGRTEAREVLAAFKEADLGWPPRSKTRLRDPIEKFFDQVDFLFSLCPGGSAKDPMFEDWNLLKDPMQTLLLLVRKFSFRFAELKQSRATFDFQDLEQFALRLLYDHSGNLSPLAGHIQDQYDYLFVDEYQDINQAQDAIVRAISKSGPAGNRFLVGDVKQSIYGFRLANPGIFLSYEKAWKLDPHSRVISLNENFRSREKILHFVNSFFSRMMTPDLGAVDYDAGAQLRFGNAAERKRMSAGEDVSVRVRLHLQETKEEGGQSENGLNRDPLRSLELEIELIADLVAQTKKEFIQENDGELRPVRWEDMVILMRSPGSRIAVFNKVFGRRGIPLLTGQGNFLEGREVQDLISILRVLDNPQQDIPLLAVLRSPIMMFSDELLLKIRAETSKGLFWNALVRFGELKVQEPERARVRETLALIERWRQLRLQMQLDELLQLILRETGYLSYLALMDRPLDRLENVDKFLGFAREFAESNRRGVYSFLQMLEAQQEFESSREPLKAAHGDGVRIMSIHQSKGLEFPIVFLANLGKRFNFDDTKGAVFIDPHLGLCPRIFPPGSLKQYPSLPSYLGAQRKRFETLAEEMRLVYVGMTRAVHELYLVGSINTAEKWIEKNRSPAQCNSAMDWIQCWLRQQDGFSFPGFSNPLVEVVLHPARTETSGPESRVERPVSGFELAEVKGLQIHYQNLRFVYPHLKATHQPAKGSVSALRAAMVWEQQETDRAPERTHFRKAIRAKIEGALDPVAVGTLHHRFLEKLVLTNEVSGPYLASEAERLVREKWIQAEDVQALALESIAGFWNSELGTTMRNAPHLVRRELPFTCRFHLSEIAQLGLISEKQVFDDHLIIQGVMDLVFFGPEGIWIIDFKTDGISAKALEERSQAYHSQVRLYARALEKIYGRKVTLAGLYFIQLQELVKVELEG